MEQVGPNRYIAFMGEAGLSVGSAGTSTISAPFKGTIEYCELKSAIGQVRTIAVRRWQRSARNARRITVS